MYKKRDNVIKAFEDRAFPFHNEFQEKESDKSDKALPVWTEVDKKRFDNRKNKIQDAKNNNLQARPSRKVINLVESNKLLQDIVHSKITHEEPLKK